MKKQTKETVRVVIDYAWRNDMDMESCRAKAKMVLSRYTMASHQWRQSCAA